MALNPSVVDANAFTSLAIFKMHAIKKIFACSDLFETAGVGELKESLQGIED
ncbi:hypothetical protein OAE79_03220 [Rhodopirellula sp.]|jgi:hypothetical protein|nr:hypothetical protein [Rhodopirellula sp.]